MVPVTAMLISGVLITWKGGSEVGRERYRDDGKSLTSDFSLGGPGAKVTITRAPRKVLYEADGQRIERDIPPATLALENGHWQAYALVAEWFAAASSPTPVQLLVPAQGATVPATVRVERRADGSRRVAVRAGPLTVEADVDAEGHVVRVRVPLQQIEVLPDGQKPTTGPPPGAASPAPPRDVPAGVVEEPTLFESGDAKLSGVLWWPASLAPGAKVPVVVFIAGSGPTDRDGNSTMGLRSDCYRQLAEALAGRGIASLRYDKRGVGGSTAGVRGEADLRLDHFVDDALAAVACARRSPRTAKVTLLGHSEGGVVALVAAGRPGGKPAIDALVLVATAGRPLKDVLREQLASKIPPADLAAFDALLPALLAGKPLATVPPSLAPLLRPSVLPFLRSELLIDPASLARALRQPLAIVQGETDAQVSVLDARLLARARKDAKLTLLPGVSHLLKGEASPALPQASYTDPTKPLGPGVVESVVAGVSR